MLYIFFMIPGYQTQQGDGLWYWATMKKFEWFFDHVIMYFLMINKKRYISSFTSPVDTKLDRVVVYDICELLRHYWKIISLLGKSSFHS